MTKKQLRAELEKAQKEIESLKADVENLEKQRTKLVEEKQGILKASLERNRKAKKKADELIDGMTSISAIDTATENVFLKLSENLEKSLKTKNIVNMTVEERDSVYYMFERFLQLGEEKKALLSEKNEEAKSVIEDIYPRYLAF